MYFCTIRFNSTYYAFSFLCLYLWVLLPKDTGHDHTLTRDLNHSIEEHCDNVIYNVSVSDAHKCDHKFHLHAKHPHCFACDNHYTSLHTLHEASVLATLTFQNALVFPFIVTPQGQMHLSISNKGPPIVS